MSNTISVIIPVYNAENTIDRCLKACLNQAGIDENSYEIIVVDNASTDSTQKLLKDYANKYDKIKYVHESKRSSYAARNKGIKKASGKYLIFVDIDNVPVKTWLSSYMDYSKKLEQNGVRSFLIGGAVEVKIQNENNAYEVYDKLNFLDQERLVKQEKFAVTANLLVERGVFELVGEFDSDLISGGDREFGQRASAKFRIYYSPKAKVTHFARNSFKKLMNKNYRIAIGFAQEHYKYHGYHLPAKVIFRQMIPNLGYLNKELFPRLTVNTTRSIPSAKVMRLKLFYIDILSRYFQLLGRTDGRKYVKNQFDNIIEKP
jgi:glycosyltransferase involved in cell wall biosynthesis